MLVREIMTSASVVTTRADTTLKAALELLAAHHVSAMPVVDADDVVVGMVSESDLVATLVPLDPRAHARPVRPDAPRELPRYVVDVMTVEVAAVRPDSDVADAVALTRSRDVRSLAVVDEAGRAVGILSSSDVVRVLARADRDLARRVSAVLEGLGLVGWSVRVDAGVVRLRGPDGSLDGQVADLLASTVPGVVRVVRG